MKRQTISARLAALRFTALWLVLTVIFTGFTACGSPTAQAATMKLAKILGTVGVSDGEGAEVTPAEDLGLYSGYQVETQAESYAWIDLDSVKLTKLDAESEIEITKDGKALEINVLSGSLFFNITEPLAADETLDIRTSSMIVGIRGTCGWVEVPNPEQMNVYLLEGRVECSNGAETAIVAAGEMAKISADGEIAVSAFSVGAVPAFVRQELEEMQGVQGTEETQGTPENDDTAAAIQTLFGTELSEPEYDVFWLRDRPGYTVSYHYSSDGELICSYEYIYNERGLLIQYSRNDGLVSYERVYDEQDQLVAGLTYDRDGQLEEHVVTENTAERRTLTSSNDASNYSYELFDETGRLLRSESYQQGEMAVYTEYEYDDQGRIAKSTTFYLSTRVPRAPDYTLYEYN